MDAPKNKTVISKRKMGKEILEDYLGNHELDYTKEQIKDYSCKHVYYCTLNQRRETGAFAILQNRHVVLIKKNFYYICSESENRSHS